MINNLKAGFVLCLMAYGLSGCAPGVTHTIVPDYEQRGVRLVALAPVENKTNDVEAAKLLRKTILDALYFKGYPRIPLDIIDEKLTVDCGKRIGEGMDALPPTVIGESLGVDAILYPRLLEWKTSFISVYAPTTVAVALELKDADTGITLWRSQESVVDRHYDFTKKRLELKAYQAYEPAVRQIVGETLSSLPDGPDFARKPPPERKFWKFW